MKNMLRIITLTMIMLGIFAVSANAEIKISEEDAVQSFMAAFDLSEDDLTYTKPYDSGFAFSNYYFRDDAVMRENNNYGNFTFSRGLGRLRFSTFSCVRNILGYGSPGTRVGMLVYEVTADGKKVLDYNMKKLGASGLYSDTITFGCNRLQYLLIAVSEEDHVYTKVYQVTTKEMATKDLLENLNINFISEEKQSEAVPGFDFPIMSDLEF